jgi:large subunit ribosomal protein L24
MYIRKDDTVVVLTGDDKGVRGKVLSVSPKTGKIVVQGVNRVYRHLKPSRQNPQGGRLSKEMPVNAIRYAADGTKELYAKKSGARIRILAKANPKYATKA